MTRVFYANIVMLKWNSRQSEAAGEGGGVVGKQNELLMQDYRYFSSNRLHNHKKMLGREIILSHLINQN